MDESDKLVELVRTLEEENEELCNENQRLEHQCWHLRNRIDALLNEANNYDLTLIAFVKSTTGLSKNTSSRDFSVVRMSQ